MKGKKGGPASVKHLFSFLAGGKEKGEGYLLLFFPSARGGKEEKRGGAAAVSAGVLVYLRQKGEKRREKGRRGHP